MAYASYVRRGDRFPPAMRMLPYSLEAAYDLIYTLRDLRRTLVLVRSGLLTFFPEETDGLQHIYGIIERDLLMAESIGQELSRQLQTALIDTDEDIVRLATMTVPATRGVWINQLYLTSTADRHITDASGAVPIPIDAKPFTITLRTVYTSANLGGFIDTSTFPCRLSDLINAIFSILHLAVPPQLHIWTEVSEGADTSVRRILASATIQDVIRARQPLTRFLLLIQDPPSAIGRDSTRELLSPEVYLL